MAGEVIVLGSGGRFGRAAVLAFHKAGWRVKAFARNRGGENLPPGTEYVCGDAMSAEAVKAAARGCDVIINALNPPYPAWSDLLPKLTANVIEAARASGATVILPGNVYNFGAGMPENLTEDTHQEPTTKKGRLRVEMEQAWAMAAKGGVRSMVLRGGDFIERRKTGNWFDSQITGKINKGIVVYPGPLDRAHAWAYLPDMARVTVGLAETRANFSGFEVFSFSGFTLTGQELIDAMQVATGRPLKVKSLPWPMIRVMGLVVPMMRELAEMAYLWQVPHGLDGAKLAAALPDFRPTPLARALADALADDATQELVEGDADRPAGRRSVDALM